MKIAIASGKGGTGKTTVAVNLAAMLAAKHMEPALVDCDVEEPNSHFFLETDWTATETATLPVPAIDTGKCLGEECRRCVDLCRFKALIFMAGEVMAFPELCHGCGLCQTACPAGAIGEDARELGIIRRGESGGAEMYGGLMRVGEAMATPLIKLAKDAAAHEPVQIWDCPPGTSCPVIASMNGADFVVMVTEPTAFGLYDLKLAVDLVREMGLPFGVVINRDGMGDDRVHRYLSEEGIPLLGSLPHSREAATAYSEGRLLIEAVPEIREGMKQVWKNICKQLNGRDWA